MRLRTLGAKLTLWNAVAFAVALCVFGALEIYAGDRSAERMLDDQLLNRANARFGPPPGANGQMGAIGQQPSGGGRGLGGGQAPGGAGGQGGGSAGFGQMLPRQPQTDELPRMRTPNNQQFKQDQTFDAIRRPRLFDPEGRGLGPDPRPPWSLELLSASRNEAPQWGLIKFDGQELRVLSIRLAAPDGSYTIVQVAQETDSLGIARRGHLLAFLAGLPLIVLVSLVLGALTTKLVIRPIRRLTAMAEAISQDPSEKRRIPVDGEDELAQLSVSLNLMTDRLQTSNEELGEALEQQKRFTSDAAHELRTPLTSIGLAAGNGLHTAATPEEMRSALQVVDRSAAGMRKLTEVLLALSRLDNGRASLPVQSMDLRPSILEAREELELAEDSRFEWRLDERPTEVFANPDAVRQIARNLIENAARYTPSEGQIGVSLQGAQFSVADTGPGIGPEHLPHLFERFYRADYARNRAAGGHGLGLSIVEALCKAIGAEVRVESQIGRGTTFFVTFAEKSPSS